MSKPQVDYPLTANGELEVILQLDHPSVAPSGLFGPPENYDPGSGPEWSVAGFRAFGVDLPGVSDATVLASRLLGYGDVTKTSDLTETQKELIVSLEIPIDEAIDEAMENVEEPEPDYPDYEDWSNDN
jgi:hypothetical protein